MNQHQHDPQEGKHLDEAVLLRAIGALKDELVAIINSGISSVQRSVSELQVEHTNHLLEQERRNSTFASRERVENLAGQVANNSGEIQRLHARDDESTKDRKDIREAIAQSERRSNKSRIDTMTKGYAAIGAGLVAIVGIAAQVFFHFFK